MEGIPKFLGDPSMNVRWKRKEVLVKVLIQVLDSSENCSENSYQMESVKDLDTSAGRVLVMGGSWIGIQNLHGSMLAGLFTTWAKELRYCPSQNRSVQTAHQQHLVSILDCLSGKVLAWIMGLCSFPIWLTLSGEHHSLVSDHCSVFWTVREVIQIRRRCPLTPGQIGEKRNKMYVFQRTKKVSEHIPCFKKEFS